MAFHIDRSYEWSSTKLYLDPLYWMHYLKAKKWFSTAVKIIKTRQIHFECLPNLKEIMSQAKILTSWKIDFALSDNTLTGQIGYSILEIWHFMLTQLTWLIQNDLSIIRKMCHNEELKLSFFFPFTYFTDPSWTN